MKKKLVIIMLTLCVVSAVGLAGVYVTEDRKGPRITIPKDDTEYTDGMDSEELLKGVTAKDKKEGDVSDSLVVEAVRENDTKTQVAVIYAAKDSKNNVTKKTRMMKEDADEKAVPETSPAPDKDTEVTGGGSLEEKSANEEAASSLPPESPRLFLTEDEITIPAGSEFNSLNYIKDITDDEDNRDTLFQSVQVDGRLNADEAGTYELRYHAKDSDGNQSNTAVLKVTVQ
jgi:hypothetical protein